MNEGVKKMVVQDQLLKIIEALVEKQRNPEAPLRICLIGGGGGINGAFLAGVQVAMVEKGINHALSMVIGVSTSIPALGHLLAAETGATEHHRFLATTYSVEAISDGFIKRFPVPRTDVQWLCQVFRGATGKPIIYREKTTTRFVGVVTDLETAAPVYIEPRSEEEFFTLIEAGCSVPGLAPPVSLRGRLSLDGMASDPCPVEWVMALPENERPTHILIIANSEQVVKPKRGTHRSPLLRVRPVRLLGSLNKKDSRQWLLMRLLFGRKVPKHIIKAFAVRGRRFRKKVEAAVVRDDVKVAVVWLPWSQSSSERNPAKVTALTRAGYEFFAKLFEASGA